ncbi:N-acetylmuramoyl-L-alanine amidase family protein [Lacrimispora sphenoides]|uniref:N-acetylmuramoyl-L-alanine amidase n=1 Tax=Lacrimispora sphenoides JCM 1415 TaxID=1297793 RepID=A0ABY1C0N0_9FIRM|nr:peptidoglycan recognition family protein [Lacrimispora sphenoides]SET49017.1 Putative cell wall binding repeat-containing protein [[Clostridium] sphenoides JCM 1415]SUY49425.1 N-acetylmuramyl-L-alanine amidase, negative regulator of AmpC, AmpD [Lacrimispora sphenoides]
MEVQKLLTPYNYSNGQIDRIKYIVIHYVGALGGAEANCKYYASQYIGASAHYFVGFSGEIWQSVEDKDIAWHCGAKTYTHLECRNSNSLGIEFCVRNNGSQTDTSRDWYFEDATVEAAAQLTKELMKQYNVPADHVIRHYDVTGKICPNPYVYNHTQHTWDSFKAALAEEQHKSGWIEEEGGWRFYLGNTGNYVTNDWYKDGENWYWFDGAGFMVKDTWKTGSDGKWYYLNNNGSMAKSQWINWKEELYRVTEDGSLFEGKMNLSTDEKGALHIV